MQIASAPVLALLLAHLLGDFPLQPRSMVDAKRAGRTAAFAAHLAIHLALSALALLAFAGGPFLRAETAAALATIAAGHLALDAAKVALLRRSPELDRWPLFLGDQLLHVAVVLLAAALLPGVDYPPPADAVARLAPYLPHAVILVAVVFPPGYLIRYVLEQMRPQLDRRADRADGPSPSDEGLENAGLVLGAIERTLLLFAFAHGSIAAVALIVGAKSAARFPQFRSRAFAEYFLIGTLLSVAAAALGGVALARLAG